MAAVTFSGFNNIDFSQILTLIMQQERQPLTALQTQKTGLETQKTAFGTLATKLSALESALTALADSTSASSLAAKSSDTSVGVSSSSGSVEGQYEVVVGTLARRQVTASTSTYATPDDEIATGGSLNLIAKDGTITEVAVTASMTAKQLVAAINAKSDAPVTASLVQASPGAYRVVLTGKNTGTDNSFTVTSTLSGGAGLIFADTEAVPDGIFGNSADENTQNAANATYTVNGLSISSTTNVASDVIPGVTLSLGKENVTSNVTVTKDGEATKDKLKKLVTAYNDLMSFIQDQQALQRNGRANISRDPLLRQLHQSLRSSVLGAYTNSGAFSRLPEIGIGFDQTGKMTLDDKAFKNALATGTVDIQKLFSGNDGVSGAFGGIREVIQGYTESGGLVADARDRITTQVKSLTNRMSLLEVQLEQRRTSLQKEFQAADQAMTQLSAQGSQLTSLGGEYRLF